MATIPTSTQTSLWQRLRSHARQRWPQIEQILTRYRAGFAYVDAVLTDGDTVKLCRLRYGGSASQWDSPSTEPVTTTRKTPTSQRLPRRHRRGSP
jgi:hypothetical protein